MSIPSLSSIPASRAKGNSLTWVRPPAGIGDCARARAQAGNAGTHVISIDRLRAGDRAGHWTILGMSGPEEHHYWSWGWHCECLPGCRPTAFATGTGAACDPECQCDSVEYFIRIRCDCGTQGIWSVRSDFFPPSLACTRSCPTRYLAKPDDRQAA